MQEKLEKVVSEYPLIVREFSQAIMCDENISHTEFQRRSLWIRAAGISIILLGTNFRNTK